MSCILPKPPNKEPAGANITQLLIDTDVRVLLANISIHISQSCVLVNSKFTVLFKKINVTLKYAYGITPPSAGPIAPSDASLGTLCMYLGSK